MIWPSFSKCRIATRASEPLILSLSMRMLCEMKRKVGTSLMIRSYRGLSRATACWALSLTLPLDHFFFLAALPPLEDVGAAFALACEANLRVSDPPHPAQARPIQRAAALPSQNPPPTSVPAAATASSGRSKAYSPCSCGPGRRGRRLEPTARLSGANAD